MINRNFRVGFCLLLVLLTGCSSLPPFDTDWINQILYTPTPAPVPLQTATPAFALTQPTQPLTEQPPSGVEPDVLRIWLPPQFNPNANNAAAAMLKDRLNDFEADHPGLEIEVRIKSESGDADLLNSLSLTSMAAPGALPDLVALPRHSLEAAAQKGLIRSLDIPGDQQDNEWYPYAQQLSEIDGITYAVPFAGDALVMVYRPELVWIKSWDDILLSESQLVFAGADPQAETALSLYASAGGEMTDAQGRPTFDQDVLIDVLELFSKGRAASLFPDASKNLSNEDQVLQEYRNKRTDMGIFHFSSFRASQDGLYQPLMSLGEQPHFTFANGWMLALAGQTPEKQQLAIELANYLTESEFLASWTQEAGYLPTRRFDGMEQVDETIAQVIQASQPIPSAEVLSTLGPLMGEAVVRVLNGEEPETVARSVMEELQ